MKTTTHSWRAHAQPVFLVLLMAWAAPAVAVELEDLAARVREHRLTNGLTVLVYQRPGAPVVAFHTLVKVGAVREVPGITGLAHMFEHMAFKGTSTIGTRDWAAERQALAAVDAAYRALDAERLGPHPEPDRVAVLAAAFRRAQEAAATFVEPNELPEILERNGGFHFNASTGMDFTEYIVSLPANRLELWAFLESERFLDPVLREFYKERDVVMEERRLRVDSQPFGRLLEQFVATAYVAHPYQNLGIGSMSDLEAFTREDARDFYERYYHPGNMIVAVAGAVDATEVIAMVERYFARLPAADPVPPLRTVEPPQIAERTVAMPDAAQPIYLEGYHRPSATDPDDAVHEVLADLLAGGRTSRLHRALVRDQRIAADVGVFNGFPGQRYPTLTSVYAVATPGHGNEEITAALHAEIERLQREPVGDQELASVKTRARAALLRSLARNEGVAEQLALYQALYGDWRELFRAVDRIGAVTAADLQRVARQTFLPTNRTVAMIVPPLEGASGDAPEAER